MILLVESKVSEILKHSNDGFGFKGAEGNPIFGHGARKCDYISCSKCEITPENIFISSNIIREIVQNHEIIEKNIKIERPKSPVSEIREVSRLDGKNISPQEQNL